MQITRLPPVLRKKSLGPCTLLLKFGREKHMRCCRYPFWSQAGDVMVRRLESLESDLDHGSGPTSFWRSVASENQVIPRGLPHRFPQSKSVISSWHSLCFSSHLFPWGHEPNSQFVFSRARSTGCYGAILASWFHFCFKIWVPWKGQKQSAPKLTGFKNSSRINGSGLPQFP